MVGVESGLRISGGAIALNIVLALVKAVWGGLRISSRPPDDTHPYRSDALTSLAALIGIAIALLGGEGYQDADDWAALLACGVIFYNGVRLLHPALHEVMDGAVQGDVAVHIRRLASEVDGVLLVEKCRVRKSGLGLLVDLPVVVDGQIAVSEGRRITHQVAEALLATRLKVMDVSVHVEPDVYEI